MADSDRRQIEQINRTSDNIEFVKSTLDIDNNFLAAIIANQMQTYQVERRQVEILEFLKKELLEVSIDDLSVDESEFVDKLFAPMKQRGDATVENTKANPAIVNLGPIITAVDIFFKADGSNSQMTVEVSTDKAEWYVFDQQTLSDSSDVFQYDVSWRWIRAWTDQNIGKIEISAKGIA